MNAALETEVMYLVDQINLQCEVEFEGLTLDVLKNKDWYLEILAILFPYLNDDLVLIQEQEDEGQAIDSILRIIDELEQFSGQTTDEIQGKEIAAGNLKQISYLVQIIAALLDAALKQNQQGQSQQQQENAQHQSRTLNGVNSKPYAKQKRALSQQNRVNVHSVQAIRNQFNESDQGEEEEEEEDQQGNHQGNHQGNNLGEHKLQDHKSKDHQLRDHKLKDSKDHKLKDSKDHKFKEQEDGDYFIDKEFDSDYPEMIESIAKQKIQQYDQEFNRVYHQNINQISHGNSGKKKENMNNGEKSSDNQLSPQYLEQKLSETKMRMKFNQKKNPQRGFSGAKSRKVKKNTAVPLSTMPALKKVKSHEVIKPILKAKAKNINKPNRMKPSSTNAVAPPQPVHKKQSIKNGIKREKKPKMVQHFSHKTNKELNKLLNWREQKIKRDKKQYEQSLKNKAFFQKQQYVKKINNLIVTLQRQKQLQQKRDFKDNLLKQNEEAVKRMTALQQWYKDKIALLKDEKKERQKPKLKKSIKVGHKEVLESIEKSLKDDNVQKLLLLTNEYRKQQKSIDQDMQKLNAKIGKIEYIE